LLFSALPQKRPGETWTAQAVNSEARTKRQALKQSKPAFFNLSDFVD